MCIRGHLIQLTHKVSYPIQYSLLLDAGEADLAACLGRDIRIEWLGQKSCIHCGKHVKKLYQNGYCFPCVTTLAECDLCIVKPHTCHFHLGTCRDETFAEEHCMIPHYVYLAVSSSVKVGLTRKGRERIRWIDQGASAATLIAEFPTRKAAGEFEMAVAEFLPDKTDWRRMLTSDSIPDVDLHEVKDMVMKRVDPVYQPYLLQDTTEVYHFSYPRTHGFQVVLKPLSLDKTPVITGRLQGMKGQYLLLDTGVLNVKRWAGYEVQVSIS
ncbi:MAG: DUF2797 domain-containing protein [Alicyclobacillus sp.]|nr:DUF2797 domain-containing protein [Alicyclobacillus sp.]